MSSHKFGALSVVITVAIVLLALAVPAAQSVPTFTWVSQGHYYTCPNGGLIATIAYNNPLYFWSLEIGQCTWCELEISGDICFTTNFIEGPINMDQGNQFLHALPLECDSGTDKTMACIASGGDSVWWDYQAGGTFSVMADNFAPPPVAGISVGSGSWVTIIDSIGNLYLYDSGSFAWKAVLGTSSPVMYTSIGDDGVIGILYQGSTAPTGCQMNSDGTLSGCKVLGGATGDIPGCIQVLDGNNILAWNQWGLYWLVGGYSGNQKWMAITGLPVPFDETCFLSSQAFTCVTRANLGGKDASGNAYFTYKGTDGNWHSGKYPQA